MVCGGGGGQVVLLQSLVNTAVVLHLGKALGVDGLGGVLLLNNAEDTVVKMLVEVLGVGESLRAGAALAGRIGSVTSKLLAGVDGGGGLLAAVRGRLLDAVNCGEMALEHVGAVEGLLGSGARAGAEATDHGALVMGQGVAVLVVLASKALDVVLAGLDGALLGALRLVGEHVRLEVLEDFAAVGVGASLALLGLVTRGVLGRARRDEAASHAGAAGGGVHGSAVGAVGEAGLERAMVEVGRGGASSEHRGLWRGDHGWRAGIWMDGLVEACVIWRKSHGVGLANVGVDQRGIWGRVHFVSEAASAGHWSAMG